MIIAPEYLPITTSFGFLEASLERVVHELREWKAEINASATLESVCEAFPAVLRMLEPLGAPWFKRLWITCVSPRWHTAYFDGFINGGDPFPPISYLAKRLGCRGLVITAASDSRQMQIYGPVDTEWLNLEWGVSATNDDPWCFDHFGPVHPFEEPAAYERRRIRDRFTIEMLTRYCIALGVPLARDSYRADAVLETPAVPPGEWRFESLREAQLRCGVKLSSPAA